jgi:acetoin utilization deacetylase AcuC-like enzyme
VKLFYTDHFELPLPLGHRFPMAKYRMLRDRIVGDPFHAPDVLLIPQAASLEQLYLAHTSEYVERVINGKLTEGEIKRIGFPWSPEMVERSRRSSGATLAAARGALAEGIAVNMAGGTHHAMREAGEGFCVFNDAAVALLTLLDEGAIQRGVVIDCDVHQGNGTAQILAGNPNTFTFSIHGARNFPLRKFPSDLDIDLPDGTNDTEYLASLGLALKEVLSNGPFDLAIYLAGADPFQGDRLGRLKLTKHGLASRDEMVLSTLRSQGIPIAIAMAGGYAHSIVDIVDIHAQTIRIASHLQKTIGNPHLYPPIN